MWLPCQRQPTCWSSTAAPNWNVLRKGGKAFKSKIRDFFFVFARVFYNNKNALGGSLGSNIPDLDGLVSRAGEQLLAIIRPAAGEDGSGMGSVATELASLLAGLSVVEESLSISTNSDIEGTIGVEAHTVDEARVVLAGLLELEGRTLVEVGTVQKNAG